MADIKEVKYAEEYHEIKPSIFRESENLDRVLQAIFDICDEQQKDLLWLSKNLLNIDLAEKSHLDFIGGIVGQPRFLSDFNTEPYFGFDRSYQSKSFGSSEDPEVGGYWNSRSYFNTASSRKLNDDEYRRLIKARAIYNQSNCTANDLLEVVNLITNSRNNTVQILRHGLIQINTDDKSGILSYFVDRLYNEDNILPIAAGVRVGLEEVAGSGGSGGSGGDSSEVSYINVPFSKNTCEPISPEIIYSPNWSPVHPDVSKPITGKYRVNGGEWVNYIFNDSTANNPAPRDFLESIVLPNGNTAIDIDGSGGGFDGEEYYPTPFSSYQGRNTLYAASSSLPMTETQEDMQSLEQTTIEFVAESNSPNDLVYLLFGGSVTAKACAMAFWGGM